MKGVVINILEDFIAENLGDEMLEEVYEKVKLSDDVPPFIMPKTYPDEDLLNIVVFLSEKTGKSVEELLFGFGQYAFNILARKFPVFFENTSSAKDFLKTIEDIIHVEVHKLYKDAVTPAILIDDSVDGKTLIRYSSPRILCDLMIGLLEGVAVKFNETITQKHIQCMKNGASECVLEVEFCNERKNNE